jgi:hypothetical protein
MMLDRGTLPADEARWLLEVKYDGWVRSEAKERPMT